MIDTEDVSTLSSALGDMDYEDVLQWEGPDPKHADKRKRAVSDGEGVECRQQPKRSTLVPAGSGHPERAVPEEDLADQPPVVTPADLYEKPKRKRHIQQDREPIQMMKGQQKFNTMETLRDTEERPPRKKKEKAKEVSLAEPVLSSSRTGKVGYAFPGPI